MSEHCTECGALLPEGSTCQTIFEEFLGLELNPIEGYGRVHFLTVACFMIQHGRYSDAALAGAQELLREYLEKQLTGPEIRQRACTGMSGTQRTWKVTRRPDELPLPKVAWSMTIVDVARSVHDPEQYCEQMLQLGCITLQEMPALFR